MNIKHLEQLFDFLSVDVATVKNLSNKNGEVLQNHFGFHLNVSGEIYYTDETLILVGEKLNKNWEFYVGIQDANPDCLRRKGLGVYVYYDTVPRIKEILEIIEISNRQ